MKMMITSTQATPFNAFVNVQWSHSTAPQSVLFVNASKDAAPMMYRICAHYVNRFSACETLR